MLIQNTMTKVTQFFVFLMLLSACGSIAPVSEHQVSKPVVSGVSSVEQKSTEPKIETDAGTESKVEEVEYFSDPKEFILNLIDIARFL